MFSRFALLLLAVLVANPAAAQPFGLRGATLGMTIETFRQLRFQELPSARIFCSNDPETRQIRPNRALSLTEDEARAGIRTCGIFVFGNAFGNNPSALQPEWLPAKVRMGRTELLPVFWFAPATGGDDDRYPRLSRIAVRTNSVYWPEVLGAFSEAFGKPDTLSTVPFPNKPGAEVYSQVAEWYRDDTRIRMTQRHEVIQLLYIELAHEELERRLLGGSQ